MRHFGGKAAGGALGKVIDRNIQIAFRYFCLNFAVIYFLDRTDAGFYNQTLQTQKGQRR